MTISERITDVYLHWWLGLPRPIPGPLAYAKAPEVKVEPVKTDGNVKYTTQGIPYKEIPPEGCESTAWQIITDAIPKGSAVLQTSEQVAAREQGFAVDTIVKVKRLWAEGLKQAQIAKRAGVSISTVKKLTATFSKQVQKGSNKQD